MRKNKQVLLVFGLLLFSHPLITNAKSYEAESQITVRIVENPLKLTEVKVPTFETKMISSNNQKVQATNDFIVTIKDTRENPQTSWQIKYQLSTFSNGKEYPISLHLGKGELTSDGQAETDYEAYSTEIASNQEKTILKTAPTVSKNYQHQIKKEDIYLSVPADAPAGEYSGMQTISLVDTTNPE
ncbi:hypothetical protein KUA55_09565 [Enterococcus sp. ALS3]|uniref:WxL domain-containing protein n=1 Tax=Enterococcus alishanensis TaxID=1303817 RepID=A0ABS6TDF1_9ENTE|nr:hypothetical protein [Enterococcus alishanensis]MBV7390929.1 hypothetical protein [Enterococcus alishanensis]